MEYSDARPGGEGARFSPDGTRVAVVAGGALRVYAAGSLAALAAHALPAGAAWRAPAVLWSHDSRDVAVCCGASGRIAVYDWEGGLTDVVAENARIGWDAVAWLRRGRRLVVTLRHGLGVRLWQLGRRWAHALLPGERCVRESSDGRFLLVVSRRGAQHVVLVYDVRDAARPRAVLCPPEQAVLDDASFAPLSEGAFLPAVYAWEGAAFGGRVFYFVCGGADAEGRALFSCRVISSGATARGLDVSRGAERAVWPAAGGLVCALVHGPDAFSLWSAAPMRHAGPVDASCVSGCTVLLRERMAGHYERAGGAPGAGAPAGGRLVVALSADGRYLSAHGGAVPAGAVHVYACADVLRGGRAPVASLQHLSAVRAASWHASAPLLAVATDGGSALRVWAPDGCGSFPLPAGVGETRAVRWAPAGDVLLVSSSDAFCVAAPNWLSV